MRILIVAISVVFAYAGLCLGAIVISKRFYKAPAAYRPPTAAQYRQFQARCNDFSKADNTGDYWHVYTKYMADDFAASDSIGNGPTWDLFAERREAKERTTWQFGVKDKRIVQSVLLRDDTGLVTYTGHLSCSVQSQGSPTPYDEQWTAEDTWSDQSGTWKLEKSVSKQSETMIGGYVADHSSILPVWRACEKGPCQS